MSLLQGLARTALLPAVGLMLLAGSARPALAGHPHTLGELIHQLRFASDDDDREDAAKDLGKLGDARALPALHQAAVYDREDDVRDEARKSVLRIVGKVRPHHGIVFTPDRVGRLMQQLLHARDDDDREDAADDLRKLRDARALPALEFATIFDDDGGVRKHARKAAEDIRKHMPPVYEELTYRYYSPSAPTAQPPPALPGIPGGQPAPYYIPQPGQADAYPRSEDNYIDYGPVNGYPTTINNTYNYIYTYTYNYNSNNTYVRAPTPTVATAPRVIYTPPVAVRRPVVIQPRVVIRKPVVVRRPVVVRKPVVVRSPAVVPRPSVRLTPTRNDRSRGSRHGNRVNTRAAPRQGLSISFSIGRSSERRRRR